jgi:hypothetical protein
MSYLRMRTVLATWLVLTVLMTLAGCGGDRREHVRSERDRYPERYERQDERHDNDRQRDAGKQSDHDRGDRRGR